MYIPWDEREYVGINYLLGKTLKEVINEGDEILKFITTEDDEIFMFHDQDCCESVFIEDINGDLDDLIGEPILMAEEITEQGDAEWGTYTWTFYKIATIKGTVVIRWNGESNGYYSESVDIITKRKD